ncbi:tRNA 2-selenouridine(34) synthase MnmH [Neisseriaceae bacterium TC5R-5]|nr:tRNA 2-selenouridine(34) synthase MnmH [Neisseriaceae bacterium TC5R-5]
MLFKVAQVSQLDQFDEIIDVRSPAEFAEDHIPAAINCPVLDDAERVRVGTLYKQVSPFAARKVGAALVAKNIAYYLETRFAQRPKSWKPLIYCWRGGQRSAAMATIFAQIGWHSHQLAGGYKAYRREVLQQLEQLPTQLQFKVVCGPTGSGKSRLLQALQQAGQQVLDLEQLASHRGSVLGRLPDAPQPPQKWFDSLLLQQLKQFDPAQPIFIEAESKKLGFISLPGALFQQMHHSPCLIVEVPIAERIHFLLEDYDFYLQDPQRLIQQLSFLKALHSNDTLNRWNAMIHAGHFAELVAELLTQHYDPLYYRSMDKHYPLLSTAQRLSLPNLNQATLAAALSSLS